MPGEEDPLSHPNGLFYYNVIFNKVRKTFYWQSEKYQKASLKKMDSSYKNYFTVDNSKIVVELPFRYQYFAKKCYSSNLIGIMTAFTSVRKMNDTDVEERTEKLLESGRHILAVRLAPGGGPQPDHVG